MDKNFDFGKEFEKFRHVNYGDLSFHAICPKCGEPVKADEQISVLKSLDDSFKPLDNSFIPILNEPNATCEKCGRIIMLFDGKIIKNKKK